MIRAVLLDLDGTLVDSLGGWNEAFEEALALGRERYPQLEAMGHGARAHLEVFRPLIHEEHRLAGGGEWSREFLRGGFARLLERYARPDQDLAEAMFACYEAAWPRHMRLYPEVPALLEELRGRYRLGIVSNGLGWEQRQKIAPLGLDGYVEAVAISEELGVRKPDPAIFEHVLRALGVAPHEAVHVGDDPAADVAGARASGLRAAVLVTRHENVGGEDVALEANAPVAKPDIPRADLDLRDLRGLASALAALDRGR